MSPARFTFHFLSLFPEQIRASLLHGLLAKGEASGVLSFRFHSIREHGLGRWKTVDDSPYGGGEGMVLRADVLDSAWLAARAEVPEGARVRTIFLSPQGPLLTAERASGWAENFDHLILVSGHYEGVDERFIEERVDEECSIGDYVLTGGELPAAVLADVVGRRVPGVLGNAGSVSSDSLEGGLLKYPQYTRPPEYRGRAVPEILLSGDHAKVRAWRESERRKRTEAKRPELLKRT